MKRLFIIILLGLMPFTSQATLTSKSKRRTFDPGHAGFTTTINGLENKILDFNMGD